MTPNATSTSTTRAATTRATTPAMGAAPALSRWRAPLHDRSVLAGIVVLLAVVTVWGVLMIRGSQPETLDQRVYDVASQLEYPGATNISVADAPTNQAAQMRLFIRDRLSHGWSEDQVIQYFVDHYGEGIREVPPFGGLDLVMWLAPVGLLLAGALMVTGVGRQWRAAAGQAAAATAADDDDNLSDADLATYRALLDADPDTADLRPPPAATRAATPSAGSEAS